MAMAFLLCSSCKYEEKEIIILGNTEAAWLWFTLSFTSYPSHAIVKDGQIKNGYGILHTEQYFEQRGYDEYKYRSFFPLLQYVLAMEN